jgi:hypothetical protein
LVDESGLSTRPHRVRTWALRGQTPVLRETFNRDRLSFIAGLTLWQFYLWIYAGGINGERAAEFLHALLRHMPGKLLVIWDGAAIHRSQFVKAVLTASAGRLWLEKLPPMRRNSTRSNISGPISRNIKSPTSSSRTAGN